MDASRITVCHGDSREVLRGYDADSFDACVCDPPYALTSIVKRFGKNGSAPAKGNDAYMRASAGFMGQAWDNGETAFDPDFWREVCRVLKPGAHVVAFSGTRTYHRMACAIEDAGFEIRDMVSWMYGSGFPKSHDVSKGIDRVLGAERSKVRVSAPTNPPNLVGGTDKGGDRPWRTVAAAQGFHEAVSDEAVSDEAVSDEAVNWQGWGTALKPALEPVCLGRKPLIGTVAANVLAHGTGALNIIGTRIGTRTASTGQAISENVAMGGSNYGRVETGEKTIGRWPSNVIIDGSDEVCDRFPCEIAPDGETLSPTRYFYTAKADADDRLGSKHPTVKPVDLMQYLIRLVTPKGGLVLDPFAGTGTTGEAAFREGCRAVLIEREERFVADIHRRIALLLAGPDERQRESIKASGRVSDPGPLFGGLAEPIGGGDGYTASSRTNNRPDRIAEIAE